ncbi:MAG: FHA domain-containing protein, partial [Prevotella sp.]|nr:FHA domain-containing protein [Prevotella sp.]
MKKLTIGRNNACDIIIPDTSDLVSRKQAVLTYSFLGKMVLYDTSNNGTYVNGQ